MEQAEWLRIGVGGVVPIHWEVSKADDGGPGTLEGWASVFNVVDLQDDIVMPGAFRKTLQEWRANKRTIPLMADHDHTSDGVIGSLKSATETPYGLRFVAQFASTEKAQNLRTLAMEKHLTGLSIFGPIIKKAFELRDGRELRLLHELGLSEISMTPFGANMDALVTSAKSGLIVPAGAVAFDDAWISDMRAALTITSKTVRDSALVGLISAKIPTPAAATQGTGGDTSTGSSTTTTTTDDTDQDAAKYALNLIGESGPNASSPGGEPADPLADLLAATTVAKTSADLDALAAELSA